MNTEEPKPGSRRAGRSSKEIKELLQTFEQSGSDIRMFCEAHNIGVSTLQKWKSRYSKNGEAPAAQDGFIPLHIVSPASNNAEGLFAEVKGIKLYRPVAASYLKELLQ